MKNVFSILILVGCWFLLSPGLAQEIEQNYRMGRRWKRWVLKVNNCIIFLKSNMLG